MSNKATQQLPANYKLTHVIDLVKHKKAIQQMVDKGRSITAAEAGDEALGPLSLLPGVWKNTEELHGFGFNMSTFRACDRAFQHNSFFIHR